MYWEIRGKDCIMSLEPRQPYCNRGSYLLKLFPSGKFALEIDWADGFPRYYFNQQYAFEEAISWLKKQNQFTEVSVWEQKNVC